MFKHDEGGAGAATSSVASLAQKARGKRATRDLIEHVDLSIEAFVGEARMTVGDLQDMKSGSVIELDAPLNRLVELRLNGTTIATGELVAVGDRFGVRIVDVS